MTLQKRSEPNRVSIDFSPLLEGAFVATRIDLARRQPLLPFQSPSRRGIRCDGLALSRFAFALVDFSPLLEGAFVATARRNTGSRAPGAFQSPSRRGIRCDIQRIPHPQRLLPFQSPSRRGIRCDDLLRSRRRSRSSNFSPLLEGAFVATAL